MNDAGADRSTRLLLGASLAFLALSAATGAVHGIGLVRIPEGSLHARAGTLGWLTLAVLAIATLLFTGDHPAPLVAWAPIGTMALYAITAWAPGGGIATAAAAAALAAGIGFLIGLAPAVRRAGPLAVPQLGILAAVVILATVPLLDLLPEVSRVGTADWVPFRVAGARSPSIAAFSVLAGMALAEWRIAAPDRPATHDTWGLAQVLLFVVGWFTLLTGTAADSLDLLVASVLFHAVAVAVFMGRLAPGLGGVRWRSSDRWAATVVLYLAAHVGLLGHLALGVADGRYLELALVPDWLLFAVDHVVFVGVVANAVLGLVRPTAWGNAAFWAVNAGLVGMALGLGAGVTAVTGLAAALLGAGLLAGAAAGLATPAARPVAG